MPFAGFEDFDACVKANQDKSDPEAYCASIHKKATGKWPAEEKYKRKEKMEGQETIKDAIVQFLKDNPNPTDEQVHAWSTERGWDYTEVEEVLYQMATKYILQNGSADEVQQVDDEIARMEKLLKEEKEENPIQATVPALNKPRVVSDQKEVPDDKEYEADYDEEGNKIKVELESLERKLRWKEFMKKAK